MISERNTFAFHSAQAMTHNAQMHMQLNNENEAKKCKYAKMQICRYALSLRGAEDQ